MMDDNKDYISYEIVNSGNDFIMHHGIKGQKWGVRRTPEQLGYNKKSSKTVTISNGQKFEKVGRKLYIEAGSIDNPKLKKAVAVHADKLNKTKTQLQQNTTWYWGVKVPHHADLIQRPTDYGAVYARSKSTKAAMKSYVRSLKIQNTRNRKSYIKKLERINDKDLNEKDRKTKRKLIDGLKKDQKNDEKAFKEILNALDTYDKKYIVADF